MTLTTAHRLDAHAGHRYRLTVNGTALRGLANPSGVYLDGAGNGRPGTNYASTFSGVVRPITVTAGPQHAVHSRR